MTQALPLGTHIQAQQDDLRSFSVLDKGVQALGRSESNQKERYLVKVQFNNGNLATFRCESKSLKTAFEMIELVGQQTQSHNATQFSEYLNSMQGKRVWVNMTNVSKDQAIKTHQVTAYKKNRQSNGLVYAFNETKGFAPVKTMGNDILVELKRYAKLHQSQLDSSAGLNNREIRVLGRKKHN